MLINEGKFHGVEFYRLMVDIELSDGESSSSESMDIIEREPQTRIPMRIDSLYNLLVCKDCAVGLPFEWVIGHLKEQHGIKKSITEVMRELNLEREPMTI